MTHRHNSSSAVLWSLWLATLGLVACGDQPLRARPAFLAASATLIDFGEVPVGQLEERSLFLINKGDAPVALIQPGGNNLGGIFSIVLPASEILPQDDVVARVFFQPNAVATFETELWVDNDSLNEARLAVTLRGAGSLTDACAGVVCNTPPRSACLDFDTSRYYPPFGTCVAGQCVYEPVDQACAFGCDLDSGLCDGDPCVGVACQTPPNGCFLANGTCTGGACVYTAANQLTCDDGNPCTLSDRCLEGQCRGTPRACDSPPGAACLNGTTLRQWSPAGSCDMSGNCRYQPNDVACQYGCVNNRCQNDPCAGGCDDGNPCTVDSCNPTQGCVHQNADGASCIAPSGDCPTGRCAAGVCQSVSGVTCQTEIDVDLCADIDVAGVCSANGRCVVEEAPPQYTCPGCPGICLQCYFIQLCIPLY